MTDMWSALARIRELHVAMYDMVYGYSEAQKKRAKEVVESWSNAEGLRTLMCLVDASVRHDLASRWEEARKAVLEALAERVDEGSAMRSEASRKLADFGEAMESICEWDKQELGEGWVAVPVATVYGAMDSLIDACGGLHYGSVTYAAYHASAVELKRVLKGTKHESRSVNGYCADCNRELSTDDYHYFHGYRCARCYRIDEEAWERSASEGNKEVQSEPSHGFVGPVEGTLRRIRLHVTLDHEECVNIGVWFEGKNEPATIAVLGDLWAVRAMYGDSNAAGIAAALDQAMSTLMRGEMIPDGWYVSMGKAYVEHGQSVDEIVDWAFKRSVSLEGAKRKFRAKKKTSD